jgi:hypothetical protein
VIVLRDDADEYVRERDALRALGAELVIELESGPLSEALGRPAVVVADRFGTVGLRGTRPTVEDVLATLDGFELACPECGPQAWGDPGA